MKTYEEKIQDVLDVLNRPLKEDVQKWLDIANGLPTYEEVKGTLHPTLKSRSLELAEQWAKESADLAEDVAIARRHAMEDESLNILDAMKYDETNPSVKKKMNTMLHKLILERKLGKGEM